MFPCTSVRKCFILFIVAAAPFIASLWYSLGMLTYRDPYESKPQFVGSTLISYVYGRRGTDAMQVAIHLEDTCVDNFKMFLKRGYFLKMDADYVFTVLENWQVPEELNTLARMSNNVFVHMATSDCGVDFCHHHHAVVDEKRANKEYSEYIFLNCDARGPYGFSGGVRPSSLGMWYRYVRKQLEVFDALGPIVSSEIGYHLQTYMIAISSRCFHIIDSLWHQRPLSYELVLEQMRQLNTSSKHMTGVSHFLTSRTDGTSLRFALGELGLSFALLDNAKTLRGTCYDSRKFEQWLGKEETNPTRCLKSEVDAQCLSPSSRRTKAGNCRTCPQLEPNDCIFVKISGENDQKYISNPWSYAKVSEYDLRDFGYKLSNLQIECTVSIAVKSQVSFDTSYYQRCNDDDLPPVGDDWLWNHFVTNGCLEGRMHRWVPPCIEKIATSTKSDFDAIYYRANNADLRDFNDDGTWMHFVGHGCQEGRKHKWLHIGPCCEGYLRAAKIRHNMVLDVVHYRRMHPQLSDFTDADLIQHFENVGCRAKWKHALRNLFIPYGYSTSCKRYFKRIESKEADALWIGDVAAPPQLVGAITLVVTHCDHSLAWLWNLLYGFDLNEIIIYSKCGLGIGNLPSHVAHARVIQSPNVGRCDHAYAHYMAHMSEHVLSSNDVVLFMKDNDHDYSRSGFARSVEKLIRIALVRGFGCALTMRSTKIEFAPFPQFEPSYYHAYRSWRKFSMGEHKRISRDRNDDFKSNYTNLGHYSDAMGIPAVEPFIPVCYGGFFAATRLQISSKPRSLWRAIEQILSRGDNIEEGHFVERSWAGILSRPLSSNEVALLNRSYQCSFCGDAFSYIRCGILGYFK